MMGQVSIIAVVQMCVLMTIASIYLISFVCTIYHFMLVLNCVFAFSFICFFSIYCSVIL